MSVEVTRAEIIATLEGARDLLETKGWVRGQYAVDRRGYSIQPESEHACAFCITGAVRSAALQGTKTLGPYLTAREETERHHKLIVALRTFDAMEPFESCGAEGTIITYNDKLTGKDEALAYLDKKIERLKGLSA